MIWLTRRLTCKNNNLMNQYITNLSKHCYYGNVTNVLNYYGIAISEAELVLLSNALDLDCSCIVADEYLFLGISNERCNHGLEKVNCYIETIPFDVDFFNTLLDKQIPVLLLINSGNLHYSYVFNGTSRNHYIVLLHKEGKRLLVSDSFVQTIPKTVYQDYIEVDEIFKEIQSGHAKCTWIKQEKPSQSIQDICKSMLNQYLECNLQCSETSVLHSLKSYARYGLNLAQALFKRESLRNLSYDIKVAGCVARFDYLEELFEKHQAINEEISIKLKDLKNRWELVSNKLMKCSMTLKHDYYLQIYGLLIPDLIKQEEALYQDVIRLGGKL